MLGGPIGDEGNILLLADAADESEIRSTLARDPWSQSGILEVSTIQRWTILLQAGEGRKEFRISASRRLLALAADASITAS